MKRTVLLVVAALAAALSCEREPLESTSSPDQNILYAKVASDEVKTAFVGDDFCWMGGDRIRVAAVEGGTLDYKYTGSPSSGTVAFTLNETSSHHVLYGDEGFAVYPSLSASNCTLAGSTLTLSLKSSYTWSDGNVEAPMMAKVVSGEALAFRHLGGLLKVSYDHVPSEAAMLIVTTPGYEIAKNIPVSLWEGHFSGSDIPYLQAYAGEDGTLQFKFTPGTASSMTFNVPLPVGPGAQHKYPTIRVALADESGNEIAYTSRTATNVQIERQTIKTMNGVTLPVVGAVTTLAGTKGRNTAAASRTGGSYADVMFGCPRGMGWINPGHKAFILDQAQSVRIWDLDAKSFSAPITYGDSGYVPWFGEYHEGLVYFAEKAKGMVYSYNPSTQAFSKLLDSYTGKSPMDVKFDSDGNAYLAVRDDHKVYRFDGGDFSAEPSKDYDFGSTGPLCIAIAPEGNLLVSTNEGKLYKVKPESGDKVVIATLSTKAPNSFVVTSSGVIYVADNYVIKKLVLGKSGYEVSVLAGSSQASARSEADGVGSAATFASIGGLMLSPDETKLYVADQSSGYIREVFLGQEQAAVHVKAASYNIRFNSESDTGDRAWDSRKAGVAQLIQDEDFDVIGFQESRPVQRTYLATQLSAYTFKTTAEEPCLAWKTSKYTKLDEGIFYMSPTPDTPSGPSPGWVSTDPGRRRLCVWVKLRDNASGKQFYFMNTHLEVTSSGTSISEAEALTIREKSAQLLVSRAGTINSGGLPLVLVGDFNSASTEDTHSTYLTGYFSDAYLSAWSSKGIWYGPKATYNGWQDTDDRAFGSSSWYQRIDYIYYKGGLTLQSYKVIRRNYNNILPSDHWPIVADFTID